MIGPDSDKGSPISEQRLATVRFATSRTIMIDILPAALLLTGFSIIYIVAFKPEQLGPLRRWFSRSTQTEPRRPISKAQVSKADGPNKNRKWGSKLALFESN
jgi:hypothetical protein